MLKSLIPFIMQTDTATLAEKKVKKKKKKPKFDPRRLHEDDCYRCGEGGELVMCDRGKCPKAYHLQCLNLSKPPHGKINKHIFVTGFLCFIFDFSVSLEHLSRPPFLAHLWRAYAIPVASSVVHHVSSMSTITTRNN